VGSLPHSLWLDTVKTTLWEKQKKARDKKNMGKKLVKNGQKLERRLQWEIHWQGSNRGHGDPGSQDFSR
jgi:hypothetical protein